MHNNLIDAHQLCSGNGLKHRPLMSSIRLVKSYEKNDDGMILDDIKVGSLKTESSLLLTVWGYRY